MSVARLESHRLAVTGPTNAAARWNGAEIYVSWSGPSAVVIGVPVLYAVDGPPALDSSKFHACRFVPEKYMSEPPFAPGATVVKRPFDAK